MIRATMTRFVSTLHRLARTSRGTVAVEFGLIAPLALVLMIGTLEFGYYLHQSATLEKSLRAGGMYAARKNINGSSFADANAKTEIENIVKTGTIDGSGDTLLSGWNETLPVTKLDITISPKTGTKDTETVSVSVITLLATVPYDPLIAGALELIGFSGLEMNFRHEQAHIGN